VGICAEEENFRSFGINHSEPSEMVCFWGVEKLKETGAIELINYFTPSLGIERFSKSLFQRTIQALQESNLRIEFRM
jgi:hypothetical protein